MALAALIFLATAAAAPSAGPVIVTGYAWAPFISPMGEAFRSHSATDDTLADWFQQADRNHDGFLTEDEMVADGDRFFQTLDLDHNGEIEPEELVRYEWQLAPEIQVNSKRRRARGEPVPPKAGQDDSLLGGGLGGDESRADRRERRRDRQVDLDVGPQGAARYALLNIPEPVAAADANFDRAVTVMEFRQAAIERFQLLDRQRQNRLTLQDLRSLLPPAPAQKPQKAQKNAPDTRVGLPLPPGN
jgi:Ca2+-binding EF-hand superfamily protein